VNLKPNQWAMMKRLLQGLNSLNEKQGFKY
jgi:hypothetical protein